MNAIGCTRCANSPDGPGRQRKKCWWIIPGGYCCAEGCSEREECDGTEDCAECNGTGLVTLDLSEARRYLRGCSVIWDKEKAAIAATKFHAHLDECQQCEAHPFNLCSIGRKLLSDLVQDDGVVEPLPPEDRR